MKSSASSSPQGILFYLEDPASVDKLFRVLKENGIDPVCFPDLQQDSGLSVYVIDSFSLDDALERMTHPVTPHPVVNAVGRPRADVTAETIAKAYYDNGLPITKIMELYQISRSTVHRRLDEAAAKGLHARSYRRSKRPIA